MNYLTPQTYNPYCLLEVKTHYLDGKLSDEQLSEHYRIWRNTNSFIILRYWDDTSKQEIYQLMKASKRGNCVYRYRIRQKLKPTQEICDSNNEAFIKTNQRVTTSNILFITLTWNPSLTLHDPISAWKIMPTLQNEFISKLKSEYGPISVLRTYEALPGGYPHVHLIIIFHSHSFPVTRHTVAYGKHQGETRYIIPDYDNELLHDFWFNQHVNAEALQSLKGVSYLLKYITKGMHTNNGGLTSAKLWVNNSRSYAISHNFNDSLMWSFTTGPVKHNSNGIMPESVSDSEKIKKEFVGIIDLDPKVELWRFVAYDPPDKSNDSSTIYETPSEYLRAMQQWFSSFGDPSVKDHSKMPQPLITSCYNTPDYDKAIAPYDHMEGY